MHGNPIDVEIGLVEELANQSEAMIASFVGVAHKGYTYEWCVENWKQLVTQVGGISSDDAESLAPWMGIWIAEAYSRIEKENNK